LTGIYYEGLKFSAGTMMDFFLRQRIQTGSGAHPASYSMGTGGSYPWGKTAGERYWPLTFI